jgi:hypothetical protein
MTRTSIPAIYIFPWNDEPIFPSKFIETITNAVGAVARVLNTQANGTPVVVYNPLAQKRYCYDYNTARRKKITHRVYRP